MAQKKSQEEPVSGMLLGLLIVLGIYVLMFLPYVIAAIINCWKDAFSG